MVVAAAMLGGLGITSPAAEAAERPPEALTRSAGTPQNSGYLAGWVEPNPDPYEFQPWPEGVATESKLLSNGVLRVVQSERQQVRIMDFDPSSYRRTRNRVLRLSGWTIGGTYMSDSGTLYVLTGRNNDGEDKDRVVVQVHKYDQELRRQGTVQFNGGYDYLGIRSPFDATMSSMVEQNGILVIHSARTIFHVPGDHPLVNHQVNVTFVIDTSTMTADPTAQLNSPYVSHSFRQFVRAHGGDAVYLDHGDAHPRALQIAVAPRSFTPTRGFEAALPPAQCEGLGPGISKDGCELERPTLREISIFRFPGNTGNNNTGTTVTGFHVGESNALTVGVSVLRSRPVQAITVMSRGYARNAYVISTDLATGASRITWLSKIRTTRFPTIRPTARTQSVGDPSITPIGNGQYAVLYSSTFRSRPSVHYALVDESGAVIARKTWRGKLFKNSGEPTMAGSKLFWINDVVVRKRKPFVHYGSIGRYLQALDLTDPKHPRLVAR